MIEPVPVEELMKRRDADIDLTPGTDQETALRFLAANSELAYPPKLITEHTDINQASINKVMTRLFDKNLADREKGRYFIPEHRIDEIRGVLGDRHNLTELASEPRQTPVHPEETVERNVENTSHASNDEVRRLLNEE